MKPAIFIGSSKEGKEIAYAVQEELKDKAEGTVWNQGIFRLSNNTIDELAEALAKSDFSAFVFSPDDLIEIRKKKYSAVRDNVIFELGLSIGELGKQRSFFLLPETNDDIRLPTDLLGLISGTYDAERSDNNWQASVAPACRKIRQAISELGKRKKPLVMPNVIADQPEGLLYHFRIQRIIHGENESDKPEYSYNVSRNSFAMVATKLFHGLHANIAGIALTGVDINSGMVSLMVLRSRKPVDKETAKGSSSEVKEQFWNDLRFTNEIDDITAELDIAMHYGS
jgi:hypothetical protein